MYLENLEDDLIRFMYNSLLAGMTKLSIPDTDVTSTYEYTLYNNGKQTAHIRKDYKNGVCVSSEGENTDVNQLGQAGVKSEKFAEKGECCCKHDGSEFKQNPYADKLKSDNEALTKENEELKKKLESYEKKMDSLRETYHQLFRAAIS